ncbi:MAG: DUF4347 domain-containing protein, partial [Gammaproteobacteria bacterium]|nr:DUF4347 domain-containing protein [Gammaproteobacteria bacterium]
MTHRPRNRTAAPLHPRRLAQALEPRLLFDGAALLSAADAAEPDAHPADAATDPVQQLVAATPVAADLTPGSSGPQAAAAAAPPPRELVLIDPTLHDAGVLAAAVRPGVEVRWLDPQQPIADQMLAAVRDGAPVESLAIVSHGGPGELLVAGRNTDVAGLQGDAATWHAVGTHLTPEADFRLYGCDVGAGVAGEAFVTTLAALTGADVAASSDRTAGPQGDWELEAATGTVQSASPFVAGTLTAYVGTLTTAPTVGDAAGTARSTAEDTPLAITGIAITDPEPAETQTVTLGVAHGTLTLAGTAGLTFSAGDGSTDASMTFSGSLAAVNAAVATLTYRPAVDYSGADTLSVSSSDGDQTGSLSIAVDVTPVNDAPSLATAVPLAVGEGGSSAFSLAQLAASANALDADIATGQQVLVQQMVQITSLPTKGTLTYNGGAVVVGSVVPVASLAALRYAHDGSDIVVPDSDSFGVVVSDGGGGATAGSVAITLAPANVAPVIGGAPALIEGQVKVVAPTIALGDGFDTLGNATIVIDDVVTGGQGTLFIDADGDDVVDPGEAITGTTTLSAAQRIGLPTQLKFFHNGAEPNAPGAIAPSFRITVTDAGGGTGTPSAPVSRTVALDVQPNNDDPTLDNAHATPAAALAVAEGTSATLLTAAMLRIADVDRNPADPLGTTPANQLVYTIGTRPTQGEIQLFVGGGLGPEGDGWIVLGDGG